MQDSSLHNFFGVLQQYGHHLSLLILYKHVLKICIQWHLNQNFLLDLLNTYLGSKPSFKLESQYCTLSLEAKDFFKHCIHSLFVHNKWFAQYGHQELFFVTLRNRVSKIWSQCKHVNQYFFIRIQENLSWCYSII